MIYFDNSATSGYKPSEVINTAIDTIRGLSANPGRSGHFLSISAMQAVFNARKSLADFLCFDYPERVIFTHGCTHAINLAILGLNLKNKRVVTTACEHNAVLRTLYHLEKRGDISLAVAPVREFGQVYADDVIRLITPNTALVVVNHVSNVTGSIAEIEKIGKFTLARKTLLLVDGAQSVGHIPVDVKESHIDMLAVAPHKGLHSIAGVGALILGERVELLPTEFGGTGTSSLSLAQPTHLPEGFEVGTVCLPAITALNTAVNITRRDFSMRKEKVSKLSRALIGGLSEIPRVKLYTAIGSEMGIVSFSVLGCPSEDFAEILSTNYEICVRGGLHCAPLLHRSLNTARSGLVRASLAFNNTPEEVEIFIDAVKEICNSLR